MEINKLNLKRNEKETFASPNFTIGKSTFDLRQPEKTPLTMAKIEQAQQLRNDVFQTNHIEERLKKVSNREFLK